MIDADVLFVLRVESTLFATELPKAITKDEKLDWNRKSCVEWWLDKGVTVPTNAICNNSWPSSKQQNSTIWPYLKEGSSGLDQLFK